MQGTDKFLFISSLVKAFSCECGWYYISSGKLTGISFNPILGYAFEEDSLRPKYKKGADGEFFYFCPLCDKKAFIEF